MKDCEDAAEKINDKNVIVLDDIFSNGTTVSQAIEAIKQNYEPKSMTVVTLLSKKY
ncbi:MAG: phosphoribosyltransferase [Erysipelotrichales bacterium]|nr:phosphoribosyltransferase [Erysipelotrichales bacterium]